MELTPYLFFDGRCDEAIEFYQKALGATVRMLMRHKDAPTPPPLTDLHVPRAQEAQEQPPPGRKVPGDKVMHCEVQIGDVRFMASDGFATGKPSFKGFSLSLTLPSEKKVDDTFKALADKGKIDMPPGQTFWADRFGMLTDRFGVQWMLTTTPKTPPRQ